MAGLMEYQGKELVNAAKEDIEKEDTSKKVSEADQDIVKKIKKHLNEKVSDVVISSRLTDSASCIVLPKHEPGAQLRKILEASGQSLGSSNPIFEINIKHKLVKKLKDMKGKQFNAYVDFLYDYAVIAEGDQPSVLPHPDLSLCQDECLVESFLKDLKCMLQQDHPYQLEEV